MSTPTLSDAEVNTITPSRANENWTFVAAGALGLFYLITSILIAWHRLFWWDEIYTVIFSRMPSLAAIYRTLVAHGADSMPPSYYVLVRTFEHLPLPLEVSARLPSAFAVAAGMLVTFDCARRLSDGLHGLIASAILSCSYLPYLGYDARPYALYFMFASVALWLWLSTGTRGVSTLLFGAAIFLAVAVHYYAVLCLVPYALWEIANWRTHRGLTHKFVAGCGAVLLGALVFSEQIRSLHHISSPVFWNRPTADALLVCYDDLFPHAILPLTAMMVVAALLCSKQIGRPAVPMAANEQLCWFFAVIPLAGFAIAKLGTNAFASRYFVNLLPGIAVAFSCLLWRQFGKELRPVCIAALLLFAVFGFARQLDLVRHPAHVRALAKLEPTHVRELLELESKIPPAHSIVIPSGEMLSLEAHYYSRHPERYVFLLTRYQSEPDTQALSNSGENRPIRHWTFQQLLQNARQATLVNPPQDVLDYLAQAGFKPILQKSGPFELVTFD